MLFQLRDDILDVIATDEEFGKPAGQDLAEGIYTLPVLLALRDPDTGPELQPLLGAPLDQPARQGTFHRGGIQAPLDDTVAASRRLVDQAVEAAQSVRDRDLGRALGDVAQSVLEGLPVSR